MIACCRHNMYFLVMAKFIMMLVIEALLSLMITFDNGKISADQTCGISLTKVGCFKDEKRPFPELLLTQRGNIDWNNYDEFLGRFVCDCANKTAAAGYTLFGIQFYGECWAGENPDVAYNTDGQSEGCICIDPDNESRDNGASSSCAGKENVNFVYAIEEDQSSDDCKDVSPSQTCQEWSEFCNYSHMIKNCRRTCKLC